MGEPVKKVRYPHATAFAIYHALAERLGPHVEQIVAAGSLRRGRESVGDIEVLFIPKTGLVQNPDSLLPELIQRDHAACCIMEMQIAGIIEPRPNVNGGFAWGQKNKLAIHTPTGIPVDLFATTEACWFNYLVCRTGGAENNKAIAMAANRIGWRWNPYGEGFEQLDRDGVPNGIKSPRMDSEEAVYKFVRLPFLQPEDRI